MNFQCYMCGKQHSLPTESLGGILRCECGTDISIPPRNYTMETQEETGDKPDAPGDVPHNENIALRSTTTDFNLVVLHTCRVLASIVFVILAGLWGLVTSCTAVLASGLNVAVLAGLSTLILCWGLLIKWISRQLLPRAARKRVRPLLLLLLGGGAFTASYLMLSDQFILNMVGVQVYIVAVLILGTLILITRVRFHWVSYVTVGMAVAICPSIVFYYGEGACHANMVTHLRWWRFKELISQSTDLYAPINNSLKMVQFRHEAINMNPSIYWDPNGIDEQSVLVVRALMGNENKGFLFPHECALFLDSRLIARAPSQVQWFVIVGEPDYGQDSYGLGFPGNLKVGVLVFAWPSKTLTMDCVLDIGIKYSSTPRPAQVYRAIAKALAGFLTITEEQVTADINTSARDSDSQAGRLIAWWRFDEVGGNVAEDSSGNALHGTLMGDPQRVPGRIGNALLFDGKDDYVDCGNDPLLDLGRPMTVATWIKVPAFKSWAAPIITKGDTAWRLQRWSNTNRLEFNVSHPLSQRTLILLGGSNLDDGQWHHVIATCEYRKMSLYIDGKLETSCSLAWNDTEAHNDKPVHIGANAEHETSKWSGMIDDVRVYNYALAPDEVADLIPPL